MPPVRTVQKFFLALLWLCAGQAFSNAVPRCYLLVSGVNNPRWESAFFTGEVVKDLDSAKRVIRLASSHPQAREELLAQLNRLRVDPNRPWIEQLKTAPAMWDLYLGTAYDMVLPYNFGYRSLVATVDSVLPTDGVIADLGSGTGIMSGSFLLSHPERYILSFDHSVAGLRRTREKLEKATELQNITGKRYEIIAADLTRIKEIPWPESYAHSEKRAAVMSMVCYALLENCSKVVKMVFDSLPSGGVFVMADPNGDWVRTIADMERAIDYDVLSAIPAGAPITDTGLALGTYINTEILMASGGASFGFLTQDQLVKVGLEQGFRLKRVTFPNPRGDLYGTFVNTVVFEKP